MPTKTICCYPRQPGWVKAQSDLVKKTLLKVPKDQKKRVLFSAHGLPRKAVDAGDPYRWQVEQTVEAVVEEMDIDGLDHVIYYQSRVGPLEWIGPSTEDELSRAAKDGVAVIVAPVAFVSEHSETLVELDIEYRKTAIEIGIAGYYRVPAVGVHADFISGLAEMVREVISGDASLLEWPRVDRHLSGNVRLPSTSQRGGRQDHDLGSTYLLGKRRSTSSPSCLGWRACSICPDCSFIIAGLRLDRINGNSSRLWSGGCMLSS